MGPSSCWRKATKLPHQELPDQVMAQGTARNGVTSTLYLSFHPNNSCIKGKEKAGTFFSWEMPLLREKDLGFTQKEHSSLSTRPKPWPLFLSSKGKAHRLSSWPRKREKREMRKTSLWIPYSAAEVDTDQRKGIKQIPSKKHVIELHDLHEQQ